MPLLVVCIDYPALQPEPIISALEYIFPRPGEFTVVTAHNPGREYLITALYDRAEALAREMKECHWAEIYIGLTSAPVRYVCRRGFRPVRHDVMAVILQSGMVEKRIANPRQIGDQCRGRSLAESDETLFALKQVCSHYCRMKKIMPPKLKLPS